jgi:hypothetical protein
MRSSLQLLAGLSAAVLLSGCLSSPGTPTSAQNDSCGLARQAVSWAQIGLVLACTKQSNACDTAGLVLKAANTTVTAICLDAVPTPQPKPQQ